MHHFIHQLDSQSCGPTSLKIYLSIIFKDERYLTLEEDWVQPSSFLDLMSAARPFGVYLTGYRIQSLSYLKRLKRPFILHQSVPNPHYVVIHPLGFGLWKRYDPASGVRIITHRFFEAFPLKMLIHDDRQKVESNVFRYFQTPRFPFMFFMMSSLFLSTMLLSFLFFPSFRFMHGMFVFLFVLSMLWLAYVLRLLTHYHRWMDDHHAKRIKTNALFKQFHFIKNMHVQLPLKTLYTVYSLIVISLYFFLQPIVLLPGLWMSSLFLMMLQRPLKKKQKKLETDVEAFESTLQFPLQDAKDLHHLNQSSLLYFYNQVLLFFMNLGVSIAAIYVSSSSTPINGTQWLLSISLFLTFYKLIDQLNEIPQIKTTLFTMMNAFINSDDVIK